MTTGCHPDFKDPPSRPRTGANPGQTPNEHPNPAQSSKRIIFQHTFPLPRKGRPRTNPRVPAKKRRSVAKKAKANDAKQQRPKKVIVPKNPKKKRIPLTPEARREIQRTNHKEKLASGLCRDCREPAIEGQTRCEKCAEKDRVSRRKNDAERRAKANDANQLKRALAEKIEAGGPTKCRECQDPPRPGQTRCESCAKRHNEYRRRSKAKPRAAKQPKSEPGTKPVTQRTPVSPEERFHLNLNTSVTAPVQPSSWTLRNIARRH